MEIFENYDLSKLNTFGIQAKAKFFTAIGSEEDLKELFYAPEFRENKKIFLGGGSNILFTHDFDGIVVLNKLAGIEISKQDEGSVLVRARGGEIWHNLVTFALERGFWGIENLSSIPGSVGAAPVQNIGAYGTDIGSVLYEVEAFDIETGEKKFFRPENYGGGYRESIFKNEFKGKYFITSVTLSLSKIPKPNLRYRSLREYVEKNKIDVNNPLEIGKAVSEIRKEKLPDPRIINNAGSFFKNVIVDEKKLQELLKIYPNMPHFTDDFGVKIPSGWLIEQCGWKGKRFGDAGVYENHALVLVNHGEATGNDIKKLAEEIIDSIYVKFGFKLVPEVNIV